MLVGQPLRRHAAILARNRAEHGAVADPPEPHPGFEQGDGAGLGAGAATNFDLAPASLSRNLQHGAAVIVRPGGRKDLDPAGAVLGLFGAAIEADDFGAAQAAGEADGENGAVADAAQIHVERRHHRQQLVGKNRFFLGWRPGMGASNAREHGRNMPVRDVEGLSELAIAPADAGKPAFERGDAERRPARRLLHAGGEIEADGLRVRGQGIEALSAQPGRELPPIRLIGAPCVFGAGVAGVIAGLFAERGQVWGGDLFGARREVAVEGVVAIRHLFFACAHQAPVLGPRAVSAAKIRRLGGLPEVDFAPFRPAFRMVRNMSDKRTLSDIFIARQARRIGDDIQ